MKNKIMGILVITLLVANLFPTTISNEEYYQVNQDFENITPSVSKRIIQDNPLTLDIKIIKPEKALYINDNKILPLFLTTFIIGPITIEAEVTGDPAEKVEFYFDGNLKNTDYNEPYTWFCDESAFLKHQLTVKAYHGDQVVDEDMISALIVNKRTTPKITLNKATEILMSEILSPASSNKTSSAFMLSEPLTKENVVNSEDGDIYTIDDTNWFIFIDDAPQAFFAHDTRYVFLNADTGEYNIVKETWPPQINNISIFDSQKLSKGNLLEIYPIVGYSNPINISQSFTSAPIGDYGDAPDGQQAYWNVTGRFPTLYNTTHSLFNRPGGHIINTGQETLGYTVSIEKDANDPSDPDGLPNLIDADEDERTFVILNGLKATIAVTVSVSSNAPEVPRYLNILMDFDQSGNWAKSNNGEEWVVVNKHVDIKPGKTETILIPGIQWGTTTFPRSPIWMRVALTREKVDKSLFSSQGWDGSGQFNYGEIEDQLLFLMDNPPIPGFAVWWPPHAGVSPGGQPPIGGGGGGAQPQPPKGDECPCKLESQYHMIRINCGDSSKHKSQNKNIVQSSIDKMGGLCGGDNGFNDAGTVNPPDPGKNAEQNFMNNLKTSLDKMMNGVKCCDVVLIYICGHGCSEGAGIAIKDTNGRTTGMLEQGKKGDTSDNTLNGLLHNSCPPCTPKGASELEDCDKLNTCCNVHLIVESCYAGKNTGNLGGYGRSVIRTSNTTVSWANCQGGIYTSGFVDGMKDSNNDRDGDGNVDIDEGHNSGEDKVDDFNRRSGKGQQPGKEDSSTPCDCKCPSECQPSVLADKRVWDPALEQWVNEIETELGSTVRFGVLIGNDGKCRNLTQLEMIDVLPSCLEYGNNADLYVNGQYQGSRPPDSQTPVADGMQLTWTLNEIPEIAPGDNIHILFDAETVEEGANENYAEVSAHCAYDPSVTVTDSDVATVYVLEEGDTTPPITEKIIGEPNDDDGYIIWPFTPIFLESTDEGGSGVNYIYYEIAWDFNEDGVWDEVFEETVYQNFVEIHMEDYGIFYGPIELRWYAVDNAGNEENRNYQQHYVMEYKK